MRRNKIYDISVDLKESMPVWPDNPEFKLEFQQSMAEGDEANLSLISMGSHTGTHVDAPSHFVQGAPTVDTMPLDILIGEATVFELDVKHNISATDLERLDLDDVKRALFKTRNSDLWQQEGFTPDFVFFDLSAAEFLIERGVKLVGIDYLSVGEFKGEEGVDVHRILLKNGVVVVEGLNLSGIHPGNYEIICLPLKLIGAEGSPARVVLREVG